MPDFVLNRTFTLRSTLGRVISFQKGEPTYVTPELAREAIAIGAEPVEAMDKSTETLGAEVVTPKELSAVERKAAVMHSFALLSDSNKRNDFGGGGQPTVKAVARVSNIELDQRELSELWKEYKAAQVG